MVTQGNKSGRNRRSSTNRGVCLKPDPRQRLKKLSVLGDSSRMRKERNTCPGRGTEISPFTISASHGLIPLSHKSPEPPDKGRARSP